MLSLPPQSTKDGPMVLEQGQPVTTRQGTLTGFQTSLEKYVASGLLKRIVVGDKMFSNWDERQRKKSLPAMPAAPETRTVIDATPPHVSISSATGIKMTEAVDAKVLDSATQPKAIPVQPVTPPQEEPKKKLGRPPNPNPVVITEKDGKFWVGDKDFATKTAAIAYTKLSAQS
jgi:hypothetical protein